MPDNDGNVLLPLNHTSANTDVCVTIDGDGCFIEAHQDKKPVNICIPCTEDSASRAGLVIEAHPLHDQLGYLATDENKFNKYLKLLSEWRGYHPKVEAVYRYIASGTLLNDLSEWKIEKKDAKTFIRFRVVIPYDLYPDIWKDPSLIQAWQDYCSQVDLKEKVLCYTLGTRLTPALKHPKGVHNPYNAKLISCNDETNFTYKGRFTSPEQANAISVEASHKAHAMLKYLVSTQGYKCDSQAIVAWAIDDGNEMLDPFATSWNLYGKVVEDDTEKLQDAKSELETNYVRQFCNALGGYGSAKKLGDISRRVAVLALDAATTGRMGITFYQDMNENEYLERLINWHETCSWWLYHDKQECVSAPNADKIIEAVYGEPKGEGYKKIKKLARERLLHNIVCGEPIDRGWVKAAVNRVSQPFSYAKDDKSGGGWDKWGWEAAFNVTCAVVRKFYLKFGEVFSLELDKTNRDRSYLYGRLLAIADRLESRARYLQTGGNDTDKRPTNAVRYMSKFAAKPFRTWNLIFSDQLNPYIQRLDGADWYQLQIDEIMSLFSSGEYERNEPLDGKYLLGYSLQRRALKPKSDDKIKEENNNESDK
jgi:CRISPR-associated protein Csd1